MTTTYTGTASRKGISAIATLTAVSRNTWICRLSVMVQGSLEILIQDVGATAYAAQWAAIKEIEYSNAARVMPTVWAAIDAMRASLPAPKEERQ